MESPVREEAAYGVVCFLDDKAHTATVTGVPIGPFLGWQHGLITPIAMSRLAVFCRRAAFERGWLDPLTKNFFNFTTTTTDDKNDEKKTTSAAVPMFPPVTVFVVSMDIQLDPCAMRRRLSWLFQPKQTNENGEETKDSATENQLGIAEADLMIAAVGSSSFALYAELFARPANALPKTKRVRLGSVQLSYVQIDVALRRPLALLPAKKAALQDGLSVERLTKAGAKPIARLSMDHVMAAFNTNNAATTQAEDTVLLTNAPLWHCVKLRMADMDFNLHLNQSMYQQFAMDAIKEAVFDFLCANIVAKEGEKKENGAAGLVVAAARMMLIARLREVGGSSDASTKDISIDSILAQLVSLSAPDQEAAPSTATGTEEEKAALRIGALKREAHLTAMQVDACVESLHIEYANEVPLSMLSFHSAAAHTAAIDGEPKLWVGLAPLVPSHATSVSEAVELYFVVMHPSYFSNKDGSMTVTKKGIAASGTLKLRQALSLETTSSL